MDEAEFVNVAIRIRPGDQHSENQPCLQIINKNPPVRKVVNCQFHSD